MGKSRGDLDPSAKTRVNHILQEVAVDETDMRRLQVVPDEMLAKAFKYLLSAKPWAKDADILREMIYVEVLRLGGLLGDGESAASLPHYMRQMEERLSRLEAEQEVLRRAFLNPQAEIG